MTTDLGWDREHPAMAEPLGAHGDRTHSFAAGRVCAWPGCTTTLSIYNGSGVCAAHDLGGHRRRLYVRHAGGTQVHHPVDDAGPSPAEHPRRSR